MHMFDAGPMVPVDEDRAARVAAEVAARYGVAVCPSVVSVVPPGGTAFVYPVWDGRHLVVPEAHAANWRKASRAAYVVHKRAVARTESAAQLRRAQVAEWVGAGLTDPEIAERLGVARACVQQDRALLKLPGNPAPHAHVVAAQTRMDIAVQLVAQGVDLVQIAATVGMKMDGLRRAMKARGLAVPPKRRAPLVIAGSKAERVRDRLRAGLSVAEMVAEFGMPWHRVRELARSVGISVADRPAVAPSETRAARQAVAARRARIAAGLAQGRDVLDLFKAERSANRAFHSDCMALGLPWPVPGLAQHLADLRKQHLAASPAALSVAQRRAEVARMAGEGAARRDMAAALGISLKVLAVDIHVQGLSVPHVPRRGAFYHRAVS